MKLGILCSGLLGQNVLLEMINRYLIEFVMTDKNSTGIIDICKTNDIDIFIGNPRNGRSAEFFTSRKVEVLISVNYLFIIEKDLLSMPEKLAFNIHGSLLPKYRGRTPHIWAIINNEKETGITAHTLVEECDAGDILKQIRIPIMEHETGADILKKYEEFYCSIIHSVLEDLNNDELKLLSQDHSKATYFGKRTPNDGLIDWNWHKERIHNWVRAQTYPYPGAYTILGDQKLIIDEIAFSEQGYDYSMTNGLVLQHSPNLCIKTPNGAVELVKIRNIDSLNIEFISNYKTVCR